MLFTLATTALISTFDPEATDAGKWQCTFEDGIRFCEYIGSDNCFNSSIYADYDHLAEAYDGKVFAVQTFDGNASQNLVVIQSNESPNVLWAFTDSKIIPVTCMIGTYER